ncbi:cytochrome P450 [Brachybacterium phenoliresistens]|uniref:Cytochrome P450 n=1 Tax=Brachybacterium phenoliresistens TaxID=396014 RepID=Z9JT64_9MICO|nr:cytochrome P450 [Brachybacterium phenoliresistens]EWS81530.1 cytochrome P450 [Brachybacterium phenoliresistens]
MSEDERRARRPGACPWAGEDAPPGLRHVGGYDAARGVLRARGATTQAGFTAEAIPRGALRHHPILLSDGPQHDEQRRAAGRRFAPAFVDAEYTGTMEVLADRLVGAAVREGACAPDHLALLYAVGVTREAVGLTHAPLEQMARRLERFMRQPPFDLSRPGLGRTRRQWALAAARGLGPLLGFHLRDVLPAVRARRRRPRGDLVSHLLAEGYTVPDILVECVTYATAGMITTREFIVMALWHLLDRPMLAERFLAGERAERFAILHEIIRLEPVVGHLYRRVHTPLEVPGAPDLAPGDLVDVCVQEANTDPRIVGEDPRALRPGRELPRGVGPAGLSFGAGEHRCPGEHLAIAETAVLLERILREHPRLRRPPQVAWEDLVAGYRLRGAELVFPRGAKG